ncbi:MAG: pyridinium-3,5-bisthiocarboxylic acid mononucleotide nickel chelatase [Micromonosporaceae bacterium]|nr:pyridinium-3,5-bisthiocarboxylic acid mononucleotide nickel chelatase [Micromonosporaceae bacterium]
MTGERHAWIDASAGIAGDMLLGALVDAGADIGAVRRAVDAVIPGAVAIVSAPLTRAGLRACKVDIDAMIADPPHRTWRGIRELLERSPLRERAQAVFARLADAEAHVHGVPADEVHFHEVGALDSIADVVGVCAALEDLRVVTLSASAVALGSGRVGTGHGELPVPVPAVLQLARHWRVHSGGQGELTTPTGMALIRTLCSTCEDLPRMLVETVGVGAGTRDSPVRPNVVRVVIGSVDDPGPDPGDEPAVLLEANVDDLDPRLWPGILAGLLESGAADAWLVPIMMKKGRPAHTLSVLCHPSRVTALRAQIFRDTSTLGVRDGALRKVVLSRAFVDIELGGATVAIKVAHRDGVIIQVMSEFDDVADLARRHRRPERLVLQEAAEAAAAAGLTIGSTLPANARPA